MSILYASTGDSHARPGGKLLMYPFQRATMKAILQFCFFSKFHQKNTFFRKRHRCASSKDAAYCLRGAGSQGLSGALVEEEEVLILTEQAQFEVSVAASSNKECPDTHEHHDHIC